MSRNQPIRVVAAKDGYAENALDLALGYADAVADQKELSEPDFVILTHTKAQLGSTTLASMLGTHAAKALKNGQKVGSSIGSVRHATLQTLGHSGRGSIIIAFYADDKMLDKIDSLPGISGIVAVPHLEGDLDNWATTWNARVHGKERGKPAQLLEDPVVEAAMKHLTIITNTSYGTLHPRDVEHANEAFRILKNKGHELDLVGIKNWAVREGWHTGAAESLVKIAVKIASLKQKPSISKFYDPDARYSRWRSEARSK